MAKSKKTPEVIVTNDEPAPPPSDRLTEALRDIPRMRTIEEEGGRVFLPPPPTVSRIGGFAQGCGGLLLTLAGVMMSLVALWFGFYLWGPALILGGGVILVIATVGVWRGFRLAIAGSAIVLIALAIIGGFWSSFVPAAGALAPLGGLNMLFQPILMLVLLVLLVALVTHLLGLGLYWRRLLPPNQRGIIFWVVGSAALVLLALVLHFTQQTQRQTWFDDRLSTWNAEASGDTPLLMGSTTNVTLGYSFVTSNADDETSIDVRQAELAAALEAGGNVIRVSASGDLLFEQETPRMFPVDDLQDAEAVAEAADRLTRQQALEDQFMAQVQASDAALYLADSQYTPYLLVWAADKDAEDVTWEIFADLQEQRVRHYAEQYQPFAYEIVNEPDAYFQYSGITLPEDTDDAAKLDLWVTQTQRLIETVNEVSPGTLVGVTVSLASDFDRDFYERALALDGLDFVGLRVFQPAAFDEIENLFADRGDPVAAGKQAWIVETWYGYCLAPQRSQALDADWLATTAAFAAKEQMTMELASDFGCFLTEGGTLFKSDVPLDGRTEVWRSWAELISQKQTPVQTVE